jgi:hypothetical protein
MDEVIEQRFAQRAQAYRCAILQGSAGVGFVCKNTLRNGSDFGGGEGGFIDKARGEVDQRGVGQLGGDQPINRRILRAAGFGGEVEVVGWHFGLKHRDEEGKVKVKRSPLHSVVVLASHLSPLRLISIA